MVEHPVLLRGATPGLLGPLILERTDEDFVSGLFEDLKKAEGLAQTQAGRATTRCGGVLRLFQPVHRVFHVALLEILCDTVGEPRLDPVRIESAGLVLRRCGRGSSSENDLEGWRRLGSRLRGWTAFTLPSELDLDPEPARRRPAVGAGNPEIDRRLALCRAAPEALTETVAPLYVAPPDVCQATKRTLLYGMIPVTSTETSDAPEPSGYSDDFVAGHLATYLTSADHPRAVPRASETLDQSAADDADLSDFVLMLRQVKYELEAFRDSPRGQALFAALNQVRLPYAGGSKQAGGEFLRAAADVLVDRATGQTFRMPEEWPPVTAADAAAIHAAARTVLEARAALVKPFAGRFDDTSRQYRVRAYVRVKWTDTCPPTLVWSANSEPFTIAAWHETGKRPPVVVDLPNIDGAFLRNLKPNVAFAVPRDLFNLLPNSTPKDGLKPGEGPDIDWICGFSIPIITVCAFIVLNIFLQLFDIVFRWMLFIKICIPKPKA